MQKPLSFFITILIGLNSIAQANLDSLWKVWNDESQADTNRLNAMHNIAWDGYLFSQPDSAFYFAQIQYDFAKSIDNKYHLAAALNLQAVSFAIRSKNEEALKYYHEGLKIQIARNDKKGIYSVYSNIGGIHDEQGNYLKALEYYRNAVKIAEEIEDIYGIAIIQMNIANILVDQGEYAKALKTYEKSLKVFEELADSKSISDAFINIGQIHINQANYKEAINCFNKTLNISEEINDQFGKAYALGCLGLVYESQGNYEQALIYHEKSLNISKGLEDKSQYASSLVDIARIYKTHRNYEKAFEYLNRSLTIYTEIENKEGIADCLNLMGLIHENKGKHKEALDCYNKCLVIHQELGNLNGLANTYNNIGILYKAQKKFDLAVDFYMKSLKICEEIGVRTLTSNVLGNIGMLFYHQKNYQQAEKYAQRSLLISNEINALESIEFNSNLLYLIYKKTANCSKALEMLELYNDTDDTLSKMDLNELLLKQKIQQEYEVKIYKDSIDNLIEINAKNEKIAKSDAELKSKRDQQLFLLIGLGIVLLFSMFIYNRFRVTNRQKKVIQHQHQRLKQNHVELEEAHKDITDSIVYAKRIQDATLTSKTYINDVLPQSFIYFNPKDLVSGDFYWVFSNNEHVFFTVADCTGHGVPGAFMSMIGNSLLNEMIIENNIQDTNIILDRVSDKVKESLDQKGEQGESRDGMDMVLCKLNKQTNELMYTGAKNPLYLIREGELIEYKGDKRPVGYYTAENVLFTSNKISLKKNDIIYLFSDGFSDQFGGETAKKYKAANFKRFLLSIHDKDMEVQQQLLSDEFDRWKGELEQIDDVCVMGVRV